MLVGSQFVVRPSGGSLYFVFSEHAPLTNLRLKAGLPTGWFEK
jgi:hypothetical protein